MYQNFVPKYPGRYLSSNVNITLPGQTASVPVGSRFAKFTTPRGRAVTALGVLFNFTGSAPGTTVQPVQDMVKEAWFKEAIADEPDVFLLVGHMPAARDSWPGGPDTQLAQQDAHAVVSRSGRDSRGSSDDADHGFRRTYTHPQLHPV
jgi:hypothetical protein